jgi:hypothetical protein
VAAERALVDLAVVGAVERHAVVLELDDHLVGLAAHELDRVLVAEPVGPLTVSYMCQCQWSSSELPSEAATPPCAATVCERVGKTLDSTAVFRPASDKLDRGAQTGTTGADDDRIKLTNRNTCTLTFSRESAAAQPA